MKINAAAVRNCLKSFDFAALFREHLGWDNHHARLNIVIGDKTFVLNAIAQKRGFVAFLCPVIPDRPTRLKIDHQVTKSVREHFIIYTDQPAGRQVWHWVRRESGKPQASRDHRFETNQSGDPLIQRLDQIAVSMEEEEIITVVNVAGRVKAALDVDKITKRFYDRFKAEHAAFLKLVRGIKTDPNLAWYTSLMLNRLMFVYFIQKKGFLDGDTDYLQNRLAMVQKLPGKDRFQSFYRYFLLRLFHEGLGKSPDERKLDPAMEKLLGRVPFLNGGFFEVHQLEEQNPDIDIPDKAFEKLFAFFDQYRWHLDERPLRADNEINPDVVGYIFEKYINQKQMGAYYTKEDITEYISKNTIIPFIFGAAEKKYLEAFKPDGTIWKLLRDDPDRYIYPAVKHGVVQDDGAVVLETELPDFVQTGMHDPKARMHDNRYNLQQAPADDPIRLVTETWREYGSRRSRCLEIRERLKRGEIHHINDLITLNLDIWQFARDVIVSSESPEVLRAFWQAIEKVTVLDPTCGSGAFLFAALRILETLYSDCLERMGRFIEAIDDKPHHPKQFSDFKDVLAQIGRHPNERYFILKSIIINNLYGVDIMAEAVEICKLRLFLKLVAQVEKVEQIEPLPDMDFNIRTGNTLVGYATAEQVRKGFTHDASGQGKLMFGDVNDAYHRFEENLFVVEKAFKQFRAQQIKHGGKITSQDKQELRKRLRDLDNELDQYLASEYGIAVGNYKSKAEYEKAFNRWKVSHQPFHWFVEFYGIMQWGGFDVIIGNPPYVELSSVAEQYTLLNYRLNKTGNLYSVCIERFIGLLKSKAKFGVIMPMSSISTPRMLPLMRLLSFCPVVHISNFAVRPGKLFVGVDMNLTICIGSTDDERKDNKTLYSTRYNRWTENSRMNLFPTLDFEKTVYDEGAAAIAKISSSSERKLLNKVMSHPRLKNILTKRGEANIFYHSGGRYFRKCIRKKLSNEYKALKVNEKDEDAIICLLSSSLYYWIWIVHSDCYHVTKGDISIIPMPETITDDEMLKKYALLLLNDMEDNSQVRIRHRADGTEQKEINYYIGKSKHILDKIDTTLANHFNLTVEDLDLILNYDCKYRFIQADIN